jgi:hypothetical protein
MPKIGYGSATKTRHVCPDGFKKFVVHNVKVIMKTFSYRLEFPQLKAIFNTQKIIFLDVTNRGYIN